MPSGVEAFEEEIKALETQSGKTVLVLKPWEPEDDEEEDREPTLEELHALPRLLISQTASETIDATTAEMDMIGRENEDDPFKMTNTASSYEALDIIAKSVSAANKDLKAQRIAAAFNKALAITLAAKGEDFWYMDTDVPEDVNKRLSALRKLWRELFKFPDEDLGIDAAGKTALQQLLLEWKEELEEQDYKF